MTPANRRRLRAPLLTGAALAIFGIGFVGGWSYLSLIGQGARELSENTAIDTVVQRIIQAESSSCPKMKNKRSTATGAAQFLDETWLRLIRTHRPELSQRGEKEVLELRHDPELSREITARLAQQNAAILRRRGFPITAGTLYLAHFAGTAGAVAILSGPEKADAALIMASADATHRITREKLVSANPFLERLTIAELKTWADRKMDTQQVNRTCVTARPNSDTVSSRVRRRGDAQSR